MNSLPPLHLQEFTKAIFANLGFKESSALNPKLGLYSLKNPYEGPKNQLTSVDFIQQMAQVLQDLLEDNQTSSDEGNTSDEERFRREAMEKNNKMHSRCKQRDT